MPEILQKMLSGLVKMDRVQNMILCAKPLSPLLMQGQQPSIFLILLVIQFQLNLRITTLKNKVPNIDKAVISVHCHNDLGLAVANSLAAVQSGARQVECTINGLGERAGNAAMEEIIMGLKTRPDHLPFSVNVKSELIMKASKLISTVTGFAVQPNKAIVGANAFAHESGIHQDGMLKNQRNI